MQRRCLFLFTRDLRCTDHPGLHYALGHYAEVIPAFCFDERQIDPAKNPYFSERVFASLVNALKELNATLDHKLLVARGTTPASVKTWIAQQELDGIVVAKDYTPFHAKRLQELKKITAQYQVKLVEVENVHTLCPVSRVYTKAQQPFKLFKYFYETARQQCPIAAQSLPDYASHAKFVAAPQPSPYQEWQTWQADALSTRKNALDCINNLEKVLINYLARRNNINIETSMLARFLKLGLISVQEVYRHVLPFEKILKEAATAFIRQLYFRDFYYHIAYHFPRVFQSNFSPKFNRLQWENNPHYFTLFCCGQTGFPLIDAAIRKLNATGTMHNRLRMVVACFLTKDLLIDWKVGEQYFARQLLDYDPCQNNGGWQWSAGTGTDSQPYFRIFNPWTQFKQYDPACRFVKKWLPELAAVPNEALLQWHKTWANYPHTRYPKPIVDHAERRKKALKLYKEAVTAGGMASLAH